MAAAGWTHPQAGDDRRQQSLFGDDGATGLVQFVNTFERRQTRERIPDLGEDLLGDRSVPPDRGKDQHIRITRHHRLSRSSMRRQARSRRKSARLSIRPGIP